MTTRLPRATTFTRSGARPTATTTARTCCASTMPSTTTRMMGCIRMAARRTATANVEAPPRRHCEERAARRSDLDPLAHASADRDCFVALRAPRNDVRLHPRRQMILAREVREPRHFRLELELHRAGRAVALLADDDLGLAVRGLHLR